MHRTLLISVRLHDGRYHGTGDWPPSPARLFQVLVAGTARGEAIADEDRAALCWLEGRSAPIIAAPKSRACLGFSNYVPNNDLDAVGGDLRRIGKIRTGKTIRPRLFDAARPFLYAWRFDPSDAANRHALAIVKMTERLYQLGRGVDMAWAWAEVLDADRIEPRLVEHFGAVYRPAKGEAEIALLSPQPGSLKSLEERFRANQQRFIGIGTKGERLFSQPPKPRFRPIPYNSPPLRLLFDLRSAGSEGAEPVFVPWPLARTVELITRIRDGAASRLIVKLPDKAPLIDRVLIGRDASEADKGARVRIAPLPSVGHPHADHAIRRILVEIPPNCPIPPADLEWGFSGLHLGADYETGEIIDEDGPTVTAAAEGSMLRHFGIEPALPAQVWRTVTPAALPEEAKRRRIDPSRLHDPAERKGTSERIEEETRAAGAVIQALRHSGIRTRAAAIRVQREPFSAKGERAEAFAPGTRFAKAQLWHVEIVFEQPLIGPLIIGDGRYLGLGLKEPVNAARPDVVVFMLAAESPIPIEHRTLLLRALRRALMSLSRRNDDSVPRLFSGHEPDGSPAQSGQHQHVFLAAADFEGDGHIDRLIVAAPWKCDRSVRPGADDRAVFDRTATAIEVVRAGKLGIVTLVMNPAGAEDRRIVGPARVWESHTSYAPTRPVRRGDDPIDLLRRDAAFECRRRGFPAPDVEVLETSSDGCGRVDSRLRLTFAAGVVGPVILGRESHRGGGLFLAAT
jgi:CRISPR-associated protein Csb2